MGFYERIQNPDVYHYPDINWGYIEKDLAETVKLSNSRKVKYFECPISFDIETTSFYSTQLDTVSKPIKLATMYAWAVSIQGHVILGRKWEQLGQVYQRLVEIFSPDSSTRVLIYIQNLSYEFQFICHRLEWSKVFAIKERKPLYCVTEDNIEFRCSYMLSGFSLEKIGENLMKYKVTKKVGDLDYSKPRHYDTPLTDAEWGYIISDVQVVVAYIQETAENDGGYHKIPLTKTGYVRKYCRKECFSYKYYRRMMKHMTLEYSEYIQLKRAFAGGFTHGAWRLVGQALSNMDSFDFTSSYPAVMVAEKFPMSRSTLRPDPSSSEEFQFYIDNYCCLFDVEFINIDGWNAHDNIISRSKCIVCENAKLNNGRIISASRIVLTITEVDYESICKFYKWESMAVTNLRTYDKSYLPASFIKAILKLYQDKTVLKDVAGKEVEYMKAKGMINSAYGMCVTDIIRSEDTFHEKWESSEPDGEKAIEAYNNNKQRFLFYPWGVWVTAYARRNLFTAIDEFGSDYVYSDTDSVKVLNVSNHTEYLQRYNRIITEKLEKACIQHNIPVDMIRPKTIKGVEKHLGIWDFDGHYDRFKTLGAKRYMVEQNGKVNITVAGLNKKITVPYLQKLAKKTNTDIFDLFTDRLYIPPEHTGKNTHTYIDYEFSTQLEDYLGNVAEIHEYSAIHLEPSDYSLSIEHEFANLLKGIYWESD